MRYREKRGEKKDRDVRRRTQEEEKVERGV
jgi:hypothetical protein